MVVRQREQSCIYNLINHFCSSLQESIVLVVTTTQLANLTNVPAVSDDRIRQLSVDNLPLALCTAWLACCSRIRRAFVQVEDLKDLPPSMVDRINYILC